MAEKKKKRCYHRRYKAINPGSYQNANTIELMSRALHKMFMEDKYTVTYEQLLEEAPELQGLLKETSFQRWTANPMFWKHRELNGTNITFLYGKVKESPTETESTFNLAYLFGYFDTDLYIKWFRMWATHPREGYFMTSGDKTFIRVLLHKFVAQCRKEWQTLDPEEREGFIEEKAYGLYKTVFMPMYDLLGRGRCDIHANMPPGHVTVMRVGRTHKKPRRKRDGL